MDAAKAMPVRDARREELGPLARLWHDAWHEAHAALVPPEVVALRTCESFEERLADDSATFRVTGPVGAPTGLCLVVADELSQLFVAARARGAGVAAALELDALHRFRAAGIQTAWLACAPGNDRAAAFYEKRDWMRVGTMIYDLHAHGRSFPFEAWRYERRVPDAGGTSSVARRLEPDEWPLYRSLRLRALSDSPDAFADTFARASAMSDGAWCERLEGATPDTALPLTAIVGGTPAGLAWGQRDPSDPSTVHLYQLWVAPEARGCGAGALLVEAVSEWARAIGARHVALAVAEDNVGATALYRSAGFVPSGPSVRLREGEARRDRPMRRELRGAP